MRWAHGDALSPRRCIGCTALYWFHDSTKCDVKATSRQYIPSWKYAYIPGQRQSFDARPASGMTCEVKSVWLANPRKLTRNETTSHRGNFATFFSLCLSSDSAGSKTNVARNCFPNRKLRRSNSHRCDAYVTGAGLSRPYKYLADAILR